MYKYLIVAVICVLFSGCREAASRSDGHDVTDLSVAGRFVIPQEDLPEQIISLAGVLESLPSISSDSAFWVTLKNCGLNQKPDHFKDGGHFWFLDRDFQSTSEPKKCTRWRLVTSQAVTTKFASTMPGLAANIRLHFRHFGKPTGQSTPQTDCLT